MARTVNYPKRAEKIKEMIDDLVNLKSADNFSSV